ncbi:cytochrome c oxidase subunit II [Sphingomonas sp. G-3-2-10]|uniref:cytochrome c oxidase subunit II n=1 Tax=Sphingomonas sp. G-3-2-10 TaxID=2728838 RepID=UPI00146DE567|nr:cytochrome c oxidase subunit II [Sphingomonas sp. G-3-2-10]NML08001.1 cytochrome c oxidase subunit II [Sphingomonas sp. G-3-2-10]
MRPNAGLQSILSGWPPPVLDPAGPYSQPVTTLAWALLIGGTVVLLVTMAALGIALFGKASLRAKLGGDKAVWIGGIAFPVVVLTGLLIWGLTLTNHLAATAPRGDEMRVRITGEMWWWRIAYLDTNGATAIMDANELHIPAGQPILLELEAADVIHSFWVPRLGGKMDMIPGRRNLLRIHADQPGVYAGQCAEFCGGPHALMGFVVVAHAPADFARWKAARIAPPTVVAGKGANLFMSSGCAACHTVRGTAANGLAGPDLSHVGSRRSLGAGILPNNRGTMAGWVADSQSIKPGNRMPAYKQFDADELQAITAYLESLK